MTVDGVDFNIDYWMQVSKDDFVEQCLRQGVYASYADIYRKALLQEVYELMKYESNVALSQKKIETTRSSSGDTVHY
jgi:hypothetical protein